MKSPSCFTLHLGCFVSGSSERRLFPFPCRSCLTEGWCSRRWRDRRRSRPKNRRKKGAPRTCPLGKISAGGGSRRRGPYSRQRWAVGYRPGLFEEGKAACSMRTGKQRAKLHSCIGQEREGQESDACKANTTRACNERFAKGWCWLSSSNTGSRHDYTDLPRPESRADLQQRGQDVDKNMLLLVLLLP